MQQTAPQVAQPTVKALKVYNATMEKARAARTDKKLSPQYQREQYNKISGEARTALSAHLEELDKQITKAKETAATAEGDFAASFNLAPADLMLAWDTLRPLADLGLAPSDMLAYVTTREQYAAMRAYGPTLATAYAVKDSGGHLSPYQVQSITESLQRDLAERAERLGLESEAVNEATANVEYLETIRSAVHNITQGVAPSIRTQTVARAGGLGQDLFSELFAAAHDGQYPDID